MEKYSFKAIINGEILFPKGFYYQGKFIILVGCEKSNHTIRRKEKIPDVEIIVTAESTIPDNVPEGRGTIELTIKKDGAYKTIASSTPEDVDHMLKYFYSTIGDVPQWLRDLVIKRHNEFVSTIIEKKSL